MLLSISTSCISKHFHAVSGDVWSLSFVWCSNAGGHPQILHATQYIKCLSVKQVQHGRWSKHGRSRLPEQIHCNPVATGHGQGMSNKVGFLSCFANQVKQALCSPFISHLHVAGQGGRGVHQGSTFGTGSGEGRSRGNVAQHSVRIHNHHAGQTVDVQVSLCVHYWYRVLSLPCTATRTKLVNIRVRLNL